MCCKTTDLHNLMLKNIKHSRQVAEIAYLLYSGSKYGVVHSEFMYTLALWHDCLKFARTAKHIYGFESLHSVSIQLEYTDTNELVISKNAENKYKKYGHMLKKLYFVPFLRYLHSIHVEPIFWHRRTTRQEFISTKLTYAQIQALFEIIVFCHMTEVRSKEKDYPLSITLLTKAYGIRTYLLLEDKLDLFQPELLEIVKQLLLIVCIADKIVSSLYSNTKEMTSLQEQRKEFKLCKIKILSALNSSEVHSMYEYFFIEKLIQQLNSIDFDAFQHHCIHIAMTTYAFPIDLFTI